MHEIFPEGAPPG